MKFGRAAQTRCINIIGPWFVLERAQLFPSSWRSCFFLLNPGGLAREAYCRRVANKDTRASGEAQPPPIFLPMFAQSHSIQRV